MKQTSAAMAALAAVCALWPGPARTAPQPSEAPVDWQLQFDFKHLQAVLARVPGEREPRLFWFLRYTVTNRTGREEYFVPQFDLYTRTGQLIRAGQGVPVFVFPQIKTLLNNPFLRDTSEMAGKLLLGEDNAKHGVAIWPDFDPAAGVVSIFVGGLSGETVRIKLPRPVRVQELDPMGKPRDVEKSELILSKTMQLTYSIPGEAAKRLDADVRLLGKSWVMR
jgi:hypothetical protein